MQIHQVKTRYSNSYVIEEDEQILVIDVARFCHPSVLDFIQSELGHDPATVRCVGCTHDDFDHMGGVRSLAKACQAELVIPLASASPISKAVNDPAAGMFRLATSMVESMRPRAWNMYFNTERDKQAHGQGHISREPEPYYPHRRLKNNQSLPGFDNWLLLHTPGHSWDSCCFFHRPSKSLITGDTLLGSNKKDCLVTPAIYTNPFHMRRTLNKLRDLAPENIYPGHGRSFHGEGLLDHL